MRSRRIKSFAAEGMTSRDSFERFPAAAPRAVFVDGIERVLAACRRKSALSAEELAERGSIEQDEMDEEPSHD
jgi:hypothetical protein